MLAHITEERSNGERGLRPRRHFQSHDQEEGLGRSVGLAAISASLLPARTTTFSPFNSGTDGDCGKKLRRVINYVQVRFILFLLRSPRQRTGKGALSPLFIFHLSRVYHRTVFTALHLFFALHAISTLATMMTLTRSRGMSVGLHSNVISPKEQQQSRPNQRP